MAGDPWNLAHEAASAAGVTLRPLTTLKEADRVLAVMVATWGSEDQLTRDFVRALQGSGTVPWGAFDGEELVGYVLGFLGMDPEDGLHVHSHMLAVLPGRRHAGLGHALKLAQRAQALDAGVHTVRWTFDPLVARNAYFNLVKLGALADRFHRHYYGDMGDDVNRGERSDRLEARWDLDLVSDGVTVGPPEDAEVVLGRDGTDERPTPTTVRPPGRFPALVWIPSDYSSLRGRDPGLAGRWRDAAAEAIEACRSAGMVASSFLREGAYVFTPEERR
ncbi:MAG: GNAT family N-acetyltransferase [Actinomycetota bacterium]|nr:GNAT family N-acetyltransferase [Actinomycetota bacterium]